MNYSKLAFTEQIKNLQLLNGSRELYSNVEESGNTDGLSEKETEFIEDLDGFYVSSIGENGFPYIQFRGGSKGFFKILSPDTLGFLDFRGNKQYISVGNLVTNNKVALFMMNYKEKTRLRIYAETEVFSLKDHPELTKKLSIGDYKAKPERAFIFKVLAFEWSCPQHITPKFTAEEIQAIFAPQEAHIKKLEKEIEDLKLQLKSASR